VPLENCDFTDKHTFEYLALSLSGLASETWSLQICLERLTHEFACFLKSVIEHINTPWRIQHFLKQQLEGHPGLLASKRRKRTIN